MAKIGTMIALAKALGTPNNTQVNSAVSAWLAAHPEATTTVQDGAVTEAKLSNSVKGKLLITESIEFEQGTISNSGALSANSNRIRTIDYIDVATLEKIVCDSSHKMWYYQWDKNKRFLSGVSSGTIREITPSILSEGTKYIKVVIVNNSTSTAILPTDETGFVCTSVKLDKESNATGENCNAFANKVIKELDNGLISFDPSDFIVGSISNTTGEIATNVNYRVCSSTLFHAEKPTVIKISAGYTCMFIEYEEDGDFIIASEWISDTRHYTLAQGSYYRIVITKSPESSGDVSDIETYVSKIKIVATSYERMRYFSRKNESTLAIAHQGYSINYRANGDCRLSSIYGAYIHGFDGAEVDLKWTSDGVPVCSHESSFTDRESGETVSITGSTYEDLITYNYYGEKIASLDEVVCACKKFGLLCVIDKISDAYTDAQWNSLFYIIQKYHMQKYCWFEASTATRADKILTWYPAATLVYDLSDTQATTALAFVRQRLTSENAFVFNCSTSNFTPEDIAALNDKITEGNIRVQIFQPDDKATYLSYLPYVGSLLSSYFTPLDFQMELSDAL